jgi:hypothetical protein
MHVCHKLEYLGNGGQGTMCIFGRFRIIGTDLLPHMCLQLYKAALVRPLGIRSWDVEHVQSCDACCSSHLLDFLDWTEMTGRLTILDMDDR